LFKHNFHTHSSFSDGKAEPEEYVQEAIASGLKSLGFSEHAPLPFENNFSVKNSDRLRQYVNEIQDLKKKYSSVLKIYTALEADYIPGVSMDFERFRNDFDLDYIIGSVHLVKSDIENLWFIDGPDREVWKKGLIRIFNNDIRAGVKAYYEQIMTMVSTQKPDVIGHIDKIGMHNHGEFFSEDESWYRDLVMQSLTLAKEHGSIIEINTRGLYKKRYHTFFPGPWIIRKMYDMKIPATISSDAHKPDDVALLLDAAAEALLTAGYKEVWIFDKNDWKAIPLI